MAKRGGTRGDIDQLRNALRPRMLIQSGGAVAPSTTVAPHHHHATEIIAEPEPVTALLSGDDVQEDLEELGVEKLARSGEQPWVGPAALDMNHYSIANVDDLEVEGTATVREDVVFTGAAGLAKLTDARELTFEAGAAGEAQVNNARQIHMVGDHVDDEAKVDGLERVVFNDEVTASSIEMPSRVEFNVAVLPGTDTTHRPGQVGWSALESVLVADVDAAPQPDEVRIALGWTVWRCATLESGGE